MKRHVVITVLSVVAVGTVPLIAQKRFEAIAITPVTTDRPQMVMRTSPSGLLRAEAVTVQMLMRYAYDLPFVRLTGLPPWGGTGLPGAIPRHGSIPAPGALRPRGAS